MVRIFRALALRGNCDLESGRRMKRFLAVLLLVQDQIAISGTSQKKRLAFDKTFHTLTAFPPKRTLNET
jgi:hypothetical protein